MLEREQAAAQPDQQIAALPGLRRAQGRAEKELIFVEHERHAERARASANSAARFASRAKTRSMNSGPARSAKGGFIWMPSARNRPARKNA